MKTKKSGSAIFMYLAIIICLLVAAVCLTLYYLNVLKNAAVLWIGIVAFMIVYHFWLRIIFGNITKKLKINIKARWFNEKPFEKNLYKLLRVKQWKDKALTFEPEAFSLKKHTFDEIAYAMTKAELDHWINQVISIFSILFAFIWGEWWIFILTAVLAMLFDAQFILIQRYNRPRVLKLLSKINKNP